jgi:D-amino peptidase
MKTYREPPACVWGAAFAGVFLIGYHAMAGTEGAVLEHTMSSERFHSVRLNGQEMGEVGLDTLWAGLRGVAVLMVSGDDKVCTEARRMLGEVEVASVKLGLGRQMAQMLSSGHARALIREKACAALQRVGRVPPFVLPSPYEKRVVYTRTEFADGHFFDGQKVVRLDGYTIAFRGESLAEVLSQW